MGANPQLTYEDAVREYLSKIHALMQMPQESDATAARDAGAAFAEILIRRADEIYGVATGMVPLAQNYLDSADPVIREGIHGQFIDQASVEWLLGTELLLIAREEQTSLSSTAAPRATHKAALLEAISAVEKSSCVPVAQGLPTDITYRALEEATSGEAAASLQQVVASTAGSISRRVQELGSDIAFDLVVGTPWAEVLQGSSLSRRDISGMLKSIPKGAGSHSAAAMTAAVKMLSAADAKIMALLNKEEEAGQRDKMKEWLDQIKQADKIELFHSLVEDLYGVAGLKKSLEGKLEAPSAAIESVNQASILIKALSDKFVVLIGRLRRLKDALRLGTLIQVPQLRLTGIAMQVALLIVIVYAGRDYIERRMAGVLRDAGFLEP